MAAQRLGKRVLSKLQSPSRARGPGGSPGGLQKRHARVTVKYDRRELQRRLDVEKWIDGRLEELYRGRVRRRGAWGRRERSRSTDLSRTPNAPGLWLHECTRSLVHPRGYPARGQAFTGLTSPAVYQDGTLLVDRERDTHSGLQSCVQPPAEGQGISIWGARRQSWGAPAALSGERVGGRGMS